MSAREADEARRHHCCPHCGEPLAPVAWPAGLTPTQSRLLAAIRAHIAAHDSPPSYEELRVALGLSSVANVHGLLRRLKERGWIDFIRYKARSISIVREAA